MPLINTHARRYNLAGFTAALAAAPLVLAGAAHAQPAPPPVDPRIGCEAPEFGGVFVPVTATLAECQYIVSGTFYYDSYDNGVYTGTLAWRDGAKVPSVRPQIPETFALPGGVGLLVPSGMAP